MTEALKNLVTTVLGLAFILLGVLGLFLPFLQGLLFLVIGISLVTYGSPRAKRLHRRLQRRLRVRFPRTMRRLEHISRKLKVSVGRAWQRLVHRWASQGDAS